MSGGFFGSGSVVGGTVTGNLLARGSFFGPIFVPTPAPPVGGQVVFQITDIEPNSAGPYLVPNNTSLISGVTVQPIPSPVGVAPLGTLAPANPLVNGLPIQVIGTVGIGGIWYWTLCLLGTVAQTFFIELDFTSVSDGPFTLTSASADFNGLFTGAGFSIWSWAMPSTGLPQDLMSTDTDVTIKW